MSLSKNNIALVILNFDSNDYLSALLNSLSNQSSNRFTTFLVDNHSKINPENKLKDLYPNVNFIRNKSNLGYSGGYNKIISELSSRGWELFLLVNPDIIFPEDSIEVLLEEYENLLNKIGDAIGLVQPAILRPDGKINTLGNVYNIFGYGWCMQDGDSLPNILETKEINSVSGSCLLVDGRSFLEIGGFDEDFFAYAEDQELSMRMKFIKKKHFVVMKSRVIHHHIFNKNRKKWFFIERNRWKIILTYFSLKTIILISPLLLLIEIMIIVFSIKNHFFRYKLLSYYSNLISFKQILKKRLLIQSIRQIDDITFISTCQNNWYYSQLKLPNKINFLSRLQALYLKMILKYI